MEDATDIPLLELDSRQEFSPSSAKTHELAPQRFICSMLEIAE